MDHWCLHFAHLHVDVIPSLWARNTNVIQPKLLQHGQC
jgi:hypothetical protein